MKRIVCLALVFMMALACAAMAEGTSITTGLPTDKPDQIMVVQMDNEPAARPQMGIGSADIVYEIELYRGGFTRYTAVFNDNIPEEVEAVRSTRIVNATVFSEYGGAYVYYGAQVYEGSNAIDFMGSKDFNKAVGTCARYNGIWVGSKDYNSNTAGDTKFVRDKKRIAPHNVIAKFGELYNMTDWTEITCKSPLKFNESFTVPEGDEATQFAVDYDNKSYAPSYIWDGSLNRYQRLYNNKPFTDADGAQVYVDNVIVQHVESGWYSGASDRPKVDLVGSGVADYFLGGKHFTGTWERADLKENTVYRDANGNEVKLNPGVTFVQIVKDAEGQSVKIG